MNFKNRFYQILTFFLCFGVIFPNSAQSAEFDTALKHAVAEYNSADGKPEKLFATVTQLDSALAAEVEALWTENNGKTMPTVKLKKGDLVVTDAGQELYVHIVKVTGSGVTTTVNGKEFTYKNSEPFRSNFERLNTLLSIKVSLFDFLIPRAEAVDQHPEIATLAFISVVMMMILFSNKGSSNALPLAGDQELLRDLKNQCELLSSGTPAAKYELSNLENLKQITMGYSRLHGARWSICRNKKNADICAEMKQAMDCIKQSAYKSAAAINQSHTAKVEVGYDKGKDLLYIENKSAQ